MNIITSTKSLSELMTPFTGQLQYAAGTSPSFWLRIAARRAEGIVHTALFTMTLAQLQLMLGISGNGGDPFHEINGYLDTCFRSWDPAFSSPPQFIGNPSNIVGAPFRVECEEEFSIDTTFVPMTAPSSINLTANLGYIFGLDTSGLSDILSLDQESVFPSTAFTIAPKVVGDNRISLTDTNRVLDQTQINITGEGTYDQTTGVLLTCLSKKPPIGLFSLTLTNIRAF